MEAEHFSLSWKNYHLNLSSGFHELLQSEYLVDVTLAVEGQFIKAHKTILSICSPYFQQLFQVNPCKHPIVIMHGMNYSTLYNILQFMYKGEVSVRQEDIPQFLKVAETLKVKGLTDRENDNTQQQSGANGLNSTEFSNSPAERQAMAIRRNKPMKPKPYTKLDPSPATTPYISIPTPPVAETAPLSTECLDTDIQKKEMPIIPKEEPVDIVEENDDYNSTLDDQSSMDVAQMLDTQLGEPSNMKNADNFYKSQQDAPSSGPGTIQCIVGKRGNPRLLIDGHTFFKKSSYKQKSYWLCRKSRRNACPAACQTQNGAIIRWPLAHSHPVIQEPFNPLEDSIVPIEQMLQILADY